jgi:hypothetical protein
MDLAYDTLQQWFKCVVNCCSQVLPHLASAIAAFTTPPPDVMELLGEEPHRCWEPLKETQKLLDNRLRTQAHVQLAHASPVLAALRASPLPVPGLLPPTGLGSHVNSNGGAQPKDMMGLSDAGVASVLFCFWLSQPKNSVM